MTIGTHAPVCRSLRKSCVLCIPLSYSCSLLKQRALSLTQEMTEPDGVDLTTLLGAIQSRDSLIRGELTEFIEGKKYRVDLD
jgi:hypothetical protein